MNKTVNLLHLYPKDMNIYGDNGNILAIKRRLQWRGINCQIINYNPQDKFPNDVDIIVGGGGQDSGQIRIIDDLLKLGPKLTKLAEQGTPMLVICGLYQLFGNWFKTKSNQVIPGIGILNIETIAKSDRLIGNIITISQEFGEIIGFENHSGQTYLKTNVKPLAKVIKGVGNNLSDKTEGARYNNVIGSYLHGSLLPKNPKLADFLILKALNKKYHTADLISLDDSLAQVALESSKKRPR